MHTPRHHTVDPVVRTYFADGARHFRLPSLAVRMIAADGPMETYDLPMGHPSGDLVFKLGSLSKLVTALGVQLLAVDERLDLAEPVSRYLPWLPQQWVNVPGPTIHDLLLHTAGLPRGVFLTGTPTVAEIVAELSAASADVSATLQRGPVKYSNLGYVLLGHIIEMASGEPYEAFISRRIFARLGMRSAGFGSPPTGLPFAPPHQLTCFRPLNQSPFDHAEAPLSPAPAPAMDLHATADDLARLAALMASSISETGPPPLPPAALARLLGEAVPVRPGLDAGAGLVFARRRFGRIAVEAAEHFGHSAALYLVPEHRFALIAMTNRAAAAADLFHMLNAVAHHRLLSPAPPLSHNPRAAERIAGVYRKHDGAALRMTPGPACLRGALEGEPWSDVHAHGDRSLILSGGQLGRYPLRLERQGDAVTAICAGPHLFIRDGVAASPPPVDPRTGIYENPEVGRVAVFKRAGTLFLAYSPMKETRLRARTSTTFVQEDGPFPNEPLCFDPSFQQMRVANRQFSRTNESY
ncbi:serine hydrolase domain-containing protein [Ralstonia solanacearum]|uniref:Beta-lactamase family protein n=1 Tax=Ralstonia solanacearum TaxID=305 RepID=A0AAE3NFD4_RALSL|nr:serine hydrolase domain-containing protein [Ralstonia solanacearum]MBB6584894.1 beta-lactamase family protein [Ralstonia solanacearum]MDB0520756.1 beta-lactamase family protein [Ralstonia solanacearum]